MPGEGPLPSTTDQLIVLNSVFNSSMATSLMLGIYTVIYLGTMYIYITKKLSHHYIVIGSITAMYLITLAQCSVQWAQVKSDLINNDMSMLGQFIAAFAEPGWQTLFNDFCGLFTSFFADGLLIWRCYNVWDGSIRVIAPLLFLLLTETTLYTTDIVLSLMDHLDPTSLAEVTKLNDFIGAALFITASTTTITASLIAYRIYSLSQRDRQSRNKRTFSKLVDILIQSAAAYAVISIWYAIETIIPETQNNVWVLDATSDYIFFIFPITAGVASTSMVARVALLSATNSTRSGIAPVSGLDFVGESTDMTSTGVAGINQLYMISRDPPSEQEGDSTKESDLVRV